MKRHDFRLHDGGAPSFDPSKAAILGPPTLGAPSVPTFAALDLVEEQALRAEGSTRFFRDEPSREWLTLGRDHSFLGAVVLREVGTVRPLPWGPVVGARVVLRLQPSAPNDVKGADDVIERREDEAYRSEGEGTALFDLMTAASGATVTLPHFAIMAIKGSRIRVDVEAPGCEGKFVRVALHAVVER